MNEPVVLHVPTAEFLRKMLTHVADAPLPGEEDKFPEITNAYRAGLEAGALAIQAVIEEFERQLGEANEASSPATS